MAFSLAAQRAQCISGPRSQPRTACRVASVSNGSRVTMSRAMWLPGSQPPAYLDGSLPGDFGFDPLGLGADPAKLKWFAEAERIHARWAMLAVAGILVQEVIKPEVFWYDAPVVIQKDLPFGILGLLAFEFFAMHWVEVRRWQDFRNPGSVDQDPIFSSYKLPSHAVGYPGGVFAPFVPGSMDELKLKEIKNGRLAMLAFIGFTMAAQTTGLGPLAALGVHLADPLGTTMFSKAAVTPGQASTLACKIEPFHDFLGAHISTPCFLQGLWP